MNVPAIRKSLERIRYEHSIRCEGNSAIVYLDAMLRVGLRACDEIQECPLPPKAPCRACDAGRRNLEVIADILREAGVPVEVER